MTVQLTMSLSLNRRGFLLNCPYSYKVFTHAEAIPASLHEQHDLDGCKSCFLQTLSSALSALIPGLPLLLFGAMPLPGTYIEILLGFTRSSMVRRPRAYCPLLPSFLIQALGSPFLLCVDCSLYPHALA